jgi:CubicO group peptidase (beta-lactamase class C family)
MDPSLKGVANAMALRRAVRAGIGCLLIACADPTISVDPMEGLEGFEAQLDGLRVQLQIPGLSAAIVQDGRIAWSKGFGYADVEQNKPVTPTTAFHLASLTKTFAATIVMQLVEQGAIDLNDPVSEYGVALESSGTILVRHLLTHTSEGVPGAAYRYNGDRFGGLDQVILRVSSRTFGALLVEEILQPLQVTHTAPNVQDQASFQLTGLNRDDFIANMATGYQSEDGNVVQVGYPSYFGTAAGLIASVEDMATYSIAIDQGRFLEAATWEQVFTPALSNAGETLPYGLGWFIYDYQGVKLEWHYGWWIGNSSLIVRAPEEGLAFVVLANSDMLSRAYGLGGDSNVMRSAVARLFVDSFVVGNEPLP